MDSFFSLLYKSLLLNFESLKPCLLINRLALSKLWFVYLLVLIVRTPVKELIMRSKDGMIPLKCLLSS